MEQTASDGSSLRRCSLSISSHRGPHQIDNDAESESVSEAGDIGDRALPSRRYSGRSSFSLSFDHRSEENGAVVSIHDEHNLQPCPSFSHHDVAVRPLPPELASPLSTDAIESSEDTKPVSGLYF